MGYKTSLFTDKRLGTKYNTFNICTKPIEKLKDYYDGIRTKPIEKLKDYYDGILIRDDNSPYHYLRTTKDNRIIIGGEDVSFELIENESICEKQYDILEQKLKEMFSEISDIEIEYKYCGCFETTKDNLGVIGEDLKHKNLWYCLGYGANGILYAIIGAKMLVKLYSGVVDDNLKLFRLDRTL